MEIDCDHGIARPCEHRRVPAIGPAVVARALRPAMHHERYRRLARKACGARRIAPDRIAIRASKAELADAGHVDAGKPGSIDARQPLQRALVTNSIEIIGRSEEHTSELQSLMPTSYA